MSEAEEIECFVVSPIRYKGERIVNQMVSLTPKQYASLSALKPSPVRKVEGESNAASGEGTPAGGSSDDAGGDENTVDLEALKAAMESLDPENEEHFTKSGKPEVSALASALGEQLNAAKRDALWQLYQDMQE